MSKKYYAQNIKNAIANNEPYAAELWSIIESKMNSNQIDHFLDVVAPYYMNGEGVQRNGFIDYKTMEYMARAIQQNKDVSKILGIDFRQISSVLQTLPEIAPLPIPTHSQQNVQQEQQINQQEQKYYDPILGYKESIIQDMEKLVNEKVLRIGETMQGARSDWYCQSANVDFDEMPTQGWKIHIAAKDLEDYKHLLETAIPEFESLGIAYKITRPNMFEEQQKNDQIGKDITIYPTFALNINNFSPKLQQMLFERIDVSPKGDVNICGRSNARYGTFRGNKGETIAPNGARYLDGRHLSYKPDYVKEDPSKIFTFYSDCVQRYNMTGDYKTYLQEAALMTQGDGRSNAFVTIDINNADRTMVEDVLSRDPAKASFVYKHAGCLFAMIHNDYAGQALTMLDRDGVNYVRPEWDFRYNLYQIAPQDVNNAIFFVENYNNSLTSGNSINCPLMQMTYLADGNMAIQVDTSLNRQFEELCQAHGVRVAELAINMSQFELGQQDIFIDGQEYGCIDICD